MSKFEAMSEIGAGLSGKEGEFHLKKLTEILDFEVAKVDAKVRKGVSKEEFAAAEKQKLALNSAKLILKSIQLYHSAK